MKVSFDFDSTLDRKDVQRFAKQCVELGHEVWIVTSRASNEEAIMRDSWVKDRILNSNKKLFRVADNVGISRSNIHFTNSEDKIHFLKGKNFIFHLDDDFDELMNIWLSGDSCKPVNVNHFEWEYDCKKLLEN